MPRVCELASILRLKDPSLGQTDLRYIFSCGCLGPLHPSSQFPREMEGVKSALLSLGSPTPFFPGEL